MVEGEKYKANNEDFVNFILGKSKTPRSSAYPSAQNSPRAALALKTDMSIGEDELLSKDTRLDPA